MTRSTHLTPMQWLLAVKKNKPKLVAQGIDQGIDVDLTQGEINPQLSHPNMPQAGKSRALHFAARTNQIDVVRMLLDAGADPRARNDLGETALAMACARWGGELGGILARRDPGSTELADDEGSFPLAIAARHGSVECVKALLDAGADPSAKCSNGMGAADHARQKGEDELAAMIEALIERRELISSQSQGAPPASASPLRM